MDLNKIIEKLYYKALDGMKEQHNLIIGVLNDAQISQQQFDSALPFIIAQLTRDLNDEQLTDKMILISKMIFIIRKEFQEGTIVNQHPDELQKLK